MNDLERAARRFGPKKVKKAAKGRRIHRSKKEVEEIVARGSVEGLRADQFQAIWVAIKKVGWKHQSHTFGGDGSLDRMYTEMANEVGGVVERMLREPNLKVEVKRV